MKKYPFLIFVAGLIVLSATQYKLLMPLVYKVVESDLFLVQSKDEGSRFSIDTQMTETAFQQCNNYIKAKLSPDETVNFSEKPLNAWSLGNYDYVVNADINVTSSTSATVNKKYVCRITYNDKDDLKGASDFNNWSVVGVSGL